MEGALARHDGVLGHQAAHLAAGRVHLEDTHAGELAVAAHAAHVDRDAALAVRIGATLLEPRARAPDRQAHAEARLEEGRGLLAVRRHVLAQAEREHAEQQPDHAQQAQRASRAEAGGAQDRELGRLRQARHRVDRADQHRDREQLVHVARLREQRRERGGGQRIAVAADAAHLVDEVDEEEQRDEEDGDEEHRPQHVAVQQVADGLHAALRRSSSCIGWITVACSRHQIRPSPSRNVAPCSPTRATTMLTWPLPTQDCVRLSRL